MIEVSLADRSYAVHVAPTLSGLGPCVRALGARRAVVVTDATVGPPWAAPTVAALGEGGVDARVVTLDAGEANKTIATWATCVDALLAARVDRRTPVVALGGGVVGDIAGFAAASVLRGVPLVQVPTTLLAMVDSSVGGKTGVNHPTGKNLVGAFYQPSLVWAALDTLGTLPVAELRAGLAEVVKTALIGDAELLDLLERHAEALGTGDRTHLGAVVERCVAVKAGVVASDEREGGWRAVLNAGHTVAHGIEAATGFGALRHGEAVAIGLVLETAWAIREGHCDDAGLAERLEGLLGRMGLPTRLPAVSRDDVVAAMRLDKKAQGDRMVVPVPARPGQMRLIDIHAERASDLLGAGE